VKYSAQVRKSDDFVEGLWSGKGDTGIPIADPAADHYIVEVTEAQHGDMRKQHLLFKNSSTHAYKIVAGLPVKQTDTRRVVRFTPNTLELEVGDAEPNVTIEVLKVDLSGVDTTINNTFTVQLKADEQKFIKITVVSGVATVPVKTTKAMITGINSNENFIVEQPLAIKVVGNALE